MDGTLTSKGQATIPKAIRDHLGLLPGDRVKFFIHPDGCVVLLPKVPVTTLRGMLRAPRRPVSVRAMEEAIADAGGNHKGPSRTRR
jgi:AbrB family looped-hinge helix DNA binding protein